MARNPGIASHIPEYYGRYDRRGLHYRASWPTWGVSMLTLLIQVFIKEVLLRKDNSLIAEV